MIDSNNQNTHVDQSGLKLPPGMRLFHSKEEMSCERIERLESLAYRYGRYYDSYLITEPDREYLWGSDDCSVIAFYRVGQCLNVAGGFISPELNPVRFLKEIIAFVDLNQLVLSFFNLEDHDALLLELLGFQRSRFGVESRIPLLKHDWQGKQYSWVRRQSNFVTRQGVSFEEWDTPSICREMHTDRVAELHLVSEEHLATKTQKSELPFFEGRLIPGHLHRRRIFVAKSETNGGRIEGFVMCTPMLDGTQWAIEMYRQREDAVRGTIPYLFQQVIDQLKREKCDEVSICPVPTIGAQRHLSGASRKVKLALFLWGASGSLVYDTRGLYHFKTRFRPNFSDTFICAYPKSTWSAVWAYIRMMNTFDLKWSKVFQKAWASNPNRKTLIKPNRAA